MNKRYKINLFKKELEMVLPRFCLGIYDSSNFNGLKELYLGAAIDNVNAGQSYSISNSDGYRHISTAELTELIKHNHPTNPIFAELFLSYFLYRGINLKDHVWKRGIWLSDGLKREGEDLVVYKNIDGKADAVYEYNYDTTIGYKIKKESQIEEKRFNLERLFRKYGKEKITTLKKIDKSNPDLVDYLFSQEYEELPEIIQKADFVLPPDILQKKSETDIWPPFFGYFIKTKQNSIRSSYRHISSFNS